MSRAHEQESWLRFYPNTALGMGLAVVFVLGMGPVRAVVLDLPIPPHGLPDYGLLAYVGFLFLAYVAAVLVATDIDLPWSWASTAEDRLEAFASWPYPRLSRRTPGQRRAAGGVLLAVAVGLLAFGDAMDWAGSYHWGVLGLVFGAGLWFGRFEGESGGRWAHLTYKATIVLGFILVSSLVGEILWWLIPQPWNPLNWRLYSLWAILHMLVVVLGVAVMADTIGRSLERRLACGMVALLFVVITSAWPVRVGETRSAELAPRDETSLWFDAVQARLAKIPAYEPVIFVAASGGGSRAALHGIAVLEALERTPPHGPLGSWDAPEVEGQALADRVLFISSVSGGSVASAHYAFGGAPAVRLAPPKNTLSEELRAAAAAEWKRLCAYHSEDRCQQPACLECSSDDAACVERECVQRRCLIYARLCTAHPEGYQRRRLEDASELVWPIHSVRVDAMGTGFNAPLMRGMVRPGLERGESMTRFWQHEFGWSEKAALAEPGSQPLLLINFTDVEAGTRLVAGFPQLPPGLLSASREAEPGWARGLLDLQDDLTVQVEEAVRMSANFPWGFDLPVLVREPRVLAIDGGVLDNTGIDTLVMLVRRLEQLADPSAASTAPTQLRERAGSLLRELGRRGVVLLEIDSGAKPEEPGGLAQFLYSLLLPVHTLSMSSYVRSIEASSSQVRLMQETLGRVALNNVVEECDAESGDPPLTHGVVQGERLTHVVYVLDTASLVTAWGLGPSQKGKLLARFLAEDAGQRLALRDEFLDLEGANTSRCAVLERSREAGFRKLVRGLQRFDEELQRHENEEKAARGKQRRRLYEDAGQKPASRRALTGSSGWIYIGQFRRRADPDAEPDSHREGWLTTNLSLGDRGRAPEELVGQTLETSDSLYLLEAMPDESGRLRRRSSPFRLPSYVFVEIQVVEEWADSGFYFARVAAPSER